MTTLPGDPELLPMTQAQIEASNKASALRELRLLLYEFNVAKLNQAEAASHHNRALLAYELHWGALPKDSTYEAELLKLGAL